MSNIKFFQMNKRFEPLKLGQSVILNVEATKMYQIAQSVNLFYLVASQP
jgi:hypothetical protein